MKKQEQPIAAAQRDLPVINSNAAGIDIGADRHWVSVPVDRDNESVRSFAEDIASAMKGDYRCELIFILQQELQLYEFYQTQILAIDAQIEQCLADFASKLDVTKKPLGKPKRRGKKQPGNAPQFDLRTHLYRISGVDFTQIQGFGALTVLILLSELGLDPTRFPTVKHFTSWLGLCPGSRVTGGKAKNSQTRSVVSRAANAFRMAAQTLCRSNSALGAYYRRMQAKMGAPKAITAAAHKLARIFYRLWTSGDQFIDPGIDTYEQRYRERVVNNLKKKALAFGLELTPISDSTQCVS
ncbi:IS110 family transposase [Calothrix sp. PCC 7507]|uniref:IS110 family transposase n=1 Tax=Calothrix sp. PCC 7507 TaxID=99598 RepID=UPI00029EED23|nr:IS110 family transposase [Calothrix sp. PCC 7507]AFY31796.1 transposase IS116/IS110/IS902 family protein [Calothrix sp. PCC 7507]